MRKQKFDTIAQVWDALDSGREVFWTNCAYHLTVEPVHPGGQAREYQLAHWTQRKGFVLRTTCIENYFGSLLVESDLSKLFTVVSA